MKNSGIFKNCDGIKKSKHFSYFSAQEVKKDNGPSSRPVSRQRKVLISRPGSRNGSRAGSRPSSRSSRKDGQLGGLQEGEEDWEWEYYYEEEDEEDFDDELGRLSPTATTAPTTRATSPFPDGQPNIVKPLIRHAEMLVLPPLPLESIKAKHIGLPSMSRAFESIHSEPDWYNPVNDLSVALAAEYLGQRSEEVARTLPSDFSETQSNADFDKSERTSHSRDKKKSKKKQQQIDDADTNSKTSGDNKSHRKKKKKGDGKFLPKITVRDLVGMLEPQLFKDDDSGTKMVMKEEAAKFSIAKQKKERNIMKKPTNTVPTAVPKTALVPPKSAAEEPIKKEIVIIHDPKNPNQVEVCMDGQSTFVQMRPHSRKSKDGKKGSISKDKNPSPSDSEAYGTGSSASEAVDGNYTGEDGREDQPSRHSRLLRLLQESEDSDCLPNSSDHDSVASLPHTGGVAVERKLSFRSIRSSGRESDGDSISGEMVKCSPPVTRKRPIIQQQPPTGSSRFMNLNLQSCYNLDPITPSSSELSTPSSPGYLDYTQFGSLERRKRLSAPPTPNRMWPYTIADEVLYEDPQQYRTSFDFHDPPGKEVEDIMMKRRVSNVSTNPLARTIQESRLLGNASPMMDMGRGSPAVMRNSPAVRTSSPLNVRQSPTFRHSPKLEQEILELGHLPPAAPHPTSSLARGYGHRSGK
jgi:hypothetical protein